MAYLPGITDTPKLGVDYAASSVQSSLFTAAVPPERRNALHLAAPVLPSLLAVAREAAIPGDRKENWWNVALPIAFGVVGAGVLAFGQYARRPLARCARRASR